MKLTAEQQAELSRISESQDITSEWEKGRGSYPSGPTHVVERLLLLIATLQAAEPPVTDATFDPTANYVKGGWERRKAIVIETEECLRCGKEVQYRSDLSERQLCAGCEAELADAASDGAE